MAVLQALGIIFQAGVCVYVAISWRTRSGARVSASAARAARGAAYGLGAL